MQNFKVMLSVLRLNSDLYIVNPVFELAYQRRLIIWKYVPTILHTLQNFL